MDEIDRLLAKLESPSESPEVPKAAAASRAAQSDASNSSIEELLHSIQQNDSPQKQSSVSQPPQSSARSTKPPIEANLLDQVKQQYEQQDQAEQQRQAQLQQQAERERQKQERQKQEKLAQLKQQRRAELEKAAAQWLKRLDRKSTEGRWFEEFACSYASPLEAAIDYLEALEEVNPQP